MGAEFFSFSGIENDNRNSLMSWLSLYQSDGIVPSRSYLVAAGDRLAGVGELLMYVAMSTWRNQCSATD